MSKYVDITSVIQVIGNVYKNPSILELEDKYIISDEDFSDSFHKVVFGTIYNLYQLGSNKIDLKLINDYLSSRPKSEALYKANKGDEWLLKIAQESNEDAFNYYYNRLKKFSLLRAYEKIGIDVSDIYDPDNIFNAKKKEQQEEFFDNSSIEKIADLINNKIDAIRAKYVDNNFSTSKQAAEGILDLINQLEEEPYVGMPLYGALINSVNHGAVLKKLFLRSAPSGYGKTRMMVADACYIACDKIYDESFGWIKCGIKNPTLFIATEQDLSEIQTLMLAFISNVDESHILNGRYEGDEKERVLEAAKVLAESPLYIEELPDFSLKDVENTIKRNLRERGVTYIFYDYLHSSMKILEEITRRSGGVRLREDNILFMISSKLKEICVIYNVFIETSTQLSADWRESDTPDQNLLRGAKAIADRIDYGSLLLPLNNKDKESLAEIVENNGITMPNMKISVYKNRRGRYKGVYLWCNADLGTCRVNPVFCTDWSYQLINIENLKVVVRESAF